MNAPAAGAVFHGSCVQDLDRLASFVSETCNRLGADADTCFAVRLATEEAFTNVLEHGYPAHQGPVDISIAAERGGVSIVVTDQSPPFDPARAPVPDVSADWETRAEGGLGLHLIRKLMDRVEHESSDSRGNVLRLFKAFAHGDACSGQGGGL